ncbi:MAG: hypothetical protein Q9172_003865 [Xanthocarpia lactea]
MHKYLALPAKAEDNAAYNPFGKIRKASVYAEPEGDEDQKPDDPENFVAELDQKYSRGEKPVVPLLPHVDEESSLISWRTDLQKRSNPGQLHRDRAPFSSGASGGTGFQAITFAPLSTTGHYLLPVSARPRRTVVIEYDQQQPPGDHRYKLIRLDPLLMSSQTHICTGMEMLVHPVFEPFGSIYCCPYRLALSVVELAFESGVARWSHYILSMHNYLASLEEHVYENPADDTRTGALWSVSKQLLQAERLLRLHILLLENIQNDFKGLEQEDAMPLDWLQPNLTEFRRLSSEFEETLKKPTVHMVDLMYKSISIRDARQSLQLNISLWRLSWVTFVFLPPTFLAGFFGMNIEEFQDNPAMKWYFIVAAPLMCIVLLSWLVVRTWTHMSPWNGSQMSISTEKL